MIDEGSDSANPFFLYLSYTAPHWPLHALEEDIAKYEGAFREGWDAERTSRHESQKGSGLLDEKWQISARDQDAPDWSDVRHKDWEDLRMAVYAAQVDRVDQGIGRIMHRLRELGEYDNTLFMFLSDNGGCAELFQEDKDIPVPSIYSTPTVDGRRVTCGNIPEPQTGTGHHIHELRPAVGEREQRSVPPVQELDAGRRHFHAFHHPLARQDKSARHRSQPYVHYRHHCHLHRSCRSHLSRRIRRQADYAHRG